MSRTSFLLLAILLFGALLRLHFLFASGWMIEGDEAAVGLQALHILRGERPIFYPGQTYLGNFESYLAAVGFAVFGASAYTLKLVPFVFALVFICLSYRIGVEVFADERTGLMAALLAALAPAYFVMWSVKVRGGFIEALVLAQMTWLWCERWVSSPHPQSPFLHKAGGNTLPAPRRSGDGGEVSKPLIFGLISAYAIWMNPITLYLLAPLGIVLLFHALKQWRGWRGAMVPTLSAMFGVLIGFLPFILFRIAHGDETFRVVANNVPPQKAWGDLTQQVWNYLWHDGLPTLIGIRNPKDKPFVLDWRLIVVPIHALALFWLGAQSRRSRGAVVSCLMTLVAFPLFAFGSLTNGNFAAIIPDSGLLTRYLLPLYILFTLALGILLVRLPRILRLSALGILIAINLWSVFSADAVVLSRNEFANQPLPADNTELIAFLEQANLRFVYTNHWIGYPLMLESRERIVTFDAFDVKFDMDRFPDYGPQVQAASRPAWVVFNPHYEPNPIDVKLKQLNISFSKKELQDFIVYYDFNPGLRISALETVLRFPYW